MAIVAVSTISHDGYVIEGYENATPSATVSGTVVGQSMYSRVTLSDADGATIGNTDNWTHTYGLMEQSLTATDADSYYLMDEAGNLYRLEEIHSGGATYTNAETTPSVVTSVHTRALVLQPVDNEGVNIPGASTLTTYVPAGAYNASAYINDSLVDTIDITSMGIATTSTGNIKTTDPTGAALITCFVAGTAILTANGTVGVETLKVGDYVIGCDGEALELKKIFIRTLTKIDLNANPELRPIRIMAGALGAGLPNRDLLVSRQHRMQIQSEMAKRMFGTARILIAANKLTKLSGIFIDQDTESVEYYHLLFEQHQVIYAEGAPSESLFIGPETLKTLSPEARAEILNIFPEITTRRHYPEPACYIPVNKQQKEFAASYAKTIQDY